MKDYEDHFVDEEELERRIAKGKIKPAFAPTLKSSRIKKQAKILKKKLKEDSEKHRLNR